MLQQLTSSIRRRAVEALDPGRSLDASTIASTETYHPVVAAQAEIGMMRGVTDATADVAECACPGPCERDHANE